MLSELAMSEQTYSIQDQKCQTGKAVCTLATIKFTQPSFEVLSPASRFLLKKSTWSKMSSLSNMVLNPEI